MGPAGGARKVIGKLASDVDKTIREEQEQLLSYFSHGLREKRQSAVTLKSTDFKKQQRCGAR